MELSTSLSLLMMILFILMAAVISVHKKHSPLIEAIPGTMGWPIIGETLSFISDFSSPAGIFTFMNKRQQRYGKVFKTFVLGRFTVFMSGREASKILLGGKDGMVSLNLFYTGQQVLGPASLLQTSGEEHKRLRRLIAQPLSIDGLKKYFHFINTLAVDTLDHWSGTTVYALEEASTFTIKVIGNMIMSLEPWGKEQEEFRANFKLISSSFASLPFKLPGTAFYRGIKARDRMYAMLDAVISKRTSGEDCKEDFLDSLILKHTKTTSEDDKLTDAQMKDNILTLLVAGHDTTTAALTWLLKFLTENPLVLDQLRDEHRQIQEQRIQGASLTWSEVNNMPYTAKVINETLRRATILPWYSRKAAQDFEIDGYQIKKGWSVNLDVVSIHHDEQVFPNPYTFDPSRFDRRRLLFTASFLTNGAFYVFGYDRSLELFKLLSDEGISKGSLESFNVLGDEDISKEDRDIIKECFSGQTFILECGGKLSLVSICDYGESISIFFLNKTTRTWKKMDNLGNQTLYLCISSSFSTPAEANWMRNIIFFPKLKRDSVVYYSTDTKKYHTLANNHGYEDYMDTKDLTLAVWIKPSFGHGCRSPFNE